MAFKNTNSAYGSVTKLFHWTMAAIVIGLICLGLLFDEIEAGLLKIQLYGLHKSFGILVLFLVTCRILWHLYSKKPALVDGMKPFEVMAAKAAHHFLYVAMIGMPLSGWLLSSAAGRTVSFFGLFSLPDFIQENHDLRELFGETHEILGYTLIITIVLHVAAALKHHLVSKDATLKRMLP
jgi:cytochrome b561